MPNFIAVLLLNRNFLMRSNTLTTSVNIHVSITTEQLLLWPPSGSGSPTHNRILIPLLLHLVAFQAAAGSGADTAMLLLVLKLTRFVSDRTAQQSPCNLQCKYTAVGLTVSQV